MPKAAWGDFEDPLVICASCKSAKRSLETVRIELVDGPDIYLCASDPITKPCALKVAEQLVEIHMPYLVLKTRDER